MSNLVDKIDALLPQTQCGECQYAGCRPYAQAMAEGKDTPNHCPPGGIDTLHQLGRLLNIDISQYEAEVSNNTRPAQIAVIDENNCIGCTKCIQACPIDAIIGSAKHMHTILSDECTGCELCVAPCPVDCIDMQPLEKTLYQADKARNRYNNRNLRTIQTQQKPNKITLSEEDKKNYIIQARKRVQQKKIKG
jgi:H+/Na+-translocating ferredoxin:NAD+ oxidoreductase subunit B